ncbi:MAG: 2-C-methyl-D-erythritol 2,4-cyclodiphosphate synthase [Erysipelotrichaceae bacterium]|nr:2-C-methyl-D-erythritol 2,4-cyclodiphosphate synthase [Erysipelotrichaceae bacterium]
MMRIGFASDIHQLVENRKLMLGGVHIPFPLGELAHSDGDVVYHALGEAILGALALGDLGTYFPNSPEYKDIDSSIIVSRIVKMMVENGYKVGNIDISITLKAPKLAPFIQIMRANIAQLLYVDIKCVSVKAGTNEDIDELGRGFAVRADAIVLLEKKEG